MAILVGIDGGGTASRAWAAEISDQGLAQGPPVVIFRGQSGAANIATTLTHTIRSHLARATQGCPSPDAVCGCFAGVLTQQDRERALNLLGELFQGARAAAYPDYAAAHAASDAEVTVIAGTGSVICSRVEGRFVKSGGGGYLLGDFGSAFRYGRRAFLAYLEGLTVIQTGSERGDAKPQRDSEAANNEAIAAIYRSPSPVAALAKFAAKFAEDVVEGNPYAVSFLQEESNRLAGQLRDHLVRISKIAPGSGGRQRRDKDLLTEAPVGPGAPLPTKEMDQAPIRVSLAGGLWKGSPVFQRSLDDAIQDMNLSVQVCFCQLKDPPVTGALRLAAELLKAPADSGGSPDSRHG